MKTGSRYWILVPALCLGTLVLVVAPIELVARRLYSESDSTSLPCLVLNDKTTGVRGVPNSDCSQKLAESPLVEYKFNNCGYRGEWQCGPRVPGINRMTLIGSSMVEGYGVPIEETMASRMPSLLSAVTGEKWEVFDEGMQWGFPTSVKLRFDGALKTSPDIIVWPITPMDIQSATFVVPDWLAPAKTTGAPAGIWARVRKGFLSKSPGEIFESHWKTTVEWLTNTKAVFMIQHLLYMDQSQYINRYLMADDDSVGYLRNPQSVLWTNRLASFDQTLADMAAHARAAGIPVIVTVVPSRAEAALISRGEWPVGVDPYALGSRIRDIAHAHGVPYVDTLEGFARVRNSESMFYPVDGHPSGAGQKVVADLLVTSLAKGAVVHAKTHQTSAMLDVN